MTSIIFIILAILFVGVSIGLAVNFYTIFLHQKIIFLFHNRCPEIIRRYLFKRYVKRVELRLVDGIIFLGNALKSGLSLMQAFQLASLEAPFPICDEFKYVVEQTRLGKNFDDAVTEWKNRLPIDDVKIFAESILILRTTGGNLIETFSSIVETIIERQRVAGRVRVATSQGVMQAALIIALPFLICGGFFVVAPWYVEPLFIHPLGWFFLASTICLQTVGGLWLRKIVRIRV